jgi:hypothetical protein
MVTVKKREKKNILEGVTVENWILNSKLCLIGLTHLELLAQVIIVL